MRRMLRGPAAAALSLAFLVALSPAAAATLTTATAAHTLSQQPQPQPQPLLPLQHPLRPAAPANSSSSSPSSSSSSSSSSSPSSSPSSSLSSLSARDRITSPQYCRYNLDCHHTQWCREPYIPGSPSVCEPRLPLDAPCPKDVSGLGSCQPALYCRFDHAASPPGRYCRRQASRPGHPCTPADAFSCAAPLSCHPRRNVCVPPPFGRAAAPCDAPRHCDALAGFHCRLDAWPAATCAAQKPPGAPCDGGARDDAVSHECRRGFCRPTTAASFAGKCEPGLPPGAPCLEDRHCAAPSTAPGKKKKKDNNNNDDPLSRTYDRPVCNRPRPDHYGTCARYSALIKRLGVTCDPARDLCDARRGLSCHPAPAEGRAVCMHAHDSPSPPDAGPLYCAPGSKYSRCPSPDLVCRRERVIPQRKRPMPFYFCLPRRVVVQPGQRCDVEFAQCAPGSHCRTVPGAIERDPDSQLDMGRRALYCVRNLPKAARCARGSDPAKFSALCQPGLACGPAGVCVAATNALRIAEDAPSHAGVNGACAVRGGPAAQPNSPPERKTNGMYNYATLKQWPCAPGLQCARNAVYGGMRVCLPPPAAPLPRGARCAAASALDERKCAAGLQCRGDWRGRGASRCLPAQGAGSFCRSGRWCTGALACAGAGAGAGGRLAVGRFWLDSRCYDANTALPFGAACTPAPNGLKGARRCRPYTRHDQNALPEPVRCLPVPADTAMKNQKHTVHKCAVDVRLFGMCDAKKLRLCADRRLYCAEDGICRPTMMMKKKKKM